MGPQVVTSVKMSVFFITNKYYLDYKCNHHQRNCFSTKGRILKDSNVREETEGSNLISTEDNPSLIKELCLLQFQYFSDGHHI